MILSLSGAGVSDGIAIGRVHLYSTGELEIPGLHLDAGDLEDEVERLHDAVQRAGRELERMEREVTGVGRGPAVELIQAHRLMLCDELLIGEAVRRVREQAINAEWALEQTAAELRRQFRRMQDDYLARRVEDLDQVVRLLQRHLKRMPEQVLGDRVPHRLDETIVIAPMLGPAELAALKARSVAGLVAEHGSIWSHAAIVARALEIPSLMGVHRAGELLREGEEAVIDGHYGILLVTPDDALKAHYLEKQATLERRRARLVQVLDKPNATLDGQSFRLYCNAESADELERARNSPAAGVGLMRTEFLLSGNELMDEDAQYQRYRGAVELLGAKVLTIRTLDAAGDKLPEGVAHLAGPNPALGMRGIRMSLALQDLFKVQLRAILRASEHGRIRILLPMLSRLDEVWRTRELIGVCVRELQARGVRPDPDLELGGMIETPAAALMAHCFARELDFLSIGSNDLIQYVLAVDRQDELVSHLFDPGSRAVVELLGLIVERTRTAGKPLQLCGELAADPQYLPVLVGLGLDQFSVPVGRLAATKAELIRLDAAACREAVAAFLSDPAMEFAALARRLAGKD
ncbi:MAG: phosphoenolpyruvate--protein phosphotransferase [Wenzhouxiangellaceae bacterium]